MTNKKKDPTGLGVVFDDELDIIFDDILLKFLASSEDEVEVLPFPKGSKSNGQDIAVMPFTKTQLTSKFRASIKRLSLESMVGVGKGKKKASVILRKKEDVDTAPM